MRKMKVHKIVEYLKLVDFYHDTFDIEDLGIEDVLMAYGGFGWLTDEELSVLKNELYRLAERNEFKEAASLANHTDDFEFSMRSYIEMGSMR